MTQEFEVAHVVPGRIRLRWCGSGVPPEEVLQGLAESPSVERVEYRPATGSLLVLHSNGLALDSLQQIASRQGVSLRDRPARPEKKLRRAAKDPQVAPARPNRRWGGVLSDVEAVVLLGLILGWVRDWFAMRSATLGTVVLVLLSVLALAVYWWRRRRPRQAEEPGLELIYG